jgi:hypothetical protein
MTRNGRLDVHHGLRTAWQAILRGVGEEGVTAWQAILRGVGVEGAAAWQAVLRAVQNVNKKLSWGLTFGKAL